MQIHMNGGNMSDNNKFLQMLNQLDCDNFNPGMQHYPVLLNAKKVCDSTEDQRQNFDCICNKVEKFLMGEVKQVVDDYPLNDET